MFFLESFDLNIMHLIIFVFKQESLEQGFTFTWSVHQFHYRIYS